MSPGEVSNVVFTDDKAFLIFLHSKDYSKEDINYVQEREKLKNNTYSFVQYFNANKSDLRINDWRNKSSRSVPNSLGYTDNISDIYFNVGNFKAAFGFNTN